VQQVLSTARATLARSRGDNQFWDRAVEPLDGAPEKRSRGGGLPRDRRQPPSDTLTREERAAVLESVRIWAEERPIILEAIRGLREWCETLSDELAQVQKRPAHALYAEMAKWGEAESASIAEESQKREPEPLVLLSQKVAANNEENHLFGKIHTSAMGGWNGSAKIE
jgi:hypothetical protein